MEGSLVAYVRCVCVCVRALRARLHVCVRALCVLCVLCVCVRRMHTFPDFSLTALALKLAEC